MPTKKESIFDIFFWQGRQIKCLPRVYVRVYVYREFDVQQKQYPLLNFEEGKFGLSPL